MKPVDATTLADLLLQREAEFVKIAECERLIQGILGQSYPYPPPPALPSLAKRKPGKRRPAAAGALPSAGGGDAPGFAGMAGCGAAGGSEIPVLKALHPPENAWRVRFVKNGESGESVIADRALIQRLLGLEEPGFTIVEVAAVTVSAGNVCQAGEVLFRRPPPPATTAEDTPAH